MVSDYIELKRIAVNYYRDLFRTEATSIPEVCSSLVTGLPQVDGIIMKA